MWTLPDELYLKVSGFMFKFGVKSNEKTLRVSNKHSRRFWVLLKNRDFMQKNKFTAFLFLQWTYLCVCSSFYWKHRISGAATFSFLFSYHLYFVHRSRKKSKSVKKMWDLFTNSSILSHQSNQLMMSCNRMNFHQTNWKYHEN